MKSSFWVLGSVTLLCLELVRCSRDSWINDENFWDKKRDEDKERTSIDENTEWALYKARRNWNEFTNEINELSSLQRSDEAVCEKEMCFEGGTCTDNICICKENQYFDGKECKDFLCNLEDNKIKCNCPDGTIWEEEKLECVAKEQDKRCDKDCGYGVCVEEEGEEEGEGEDEEAGEKKKFCRCFAIATNEGNSKEGRCILNPALCPTTELNTEDNMKCKCEGIYKQADDGITCVFKTCDDVGSTDCNTKNEVCNMNWKNGYSCTCPKDTTRNNDEEDCRKICNDHTDCQNEGKCEGNDSLKTCSCLEGTGGPSCEIVPSCKDLKCGDDANCVYNSTSKVGECRCKDRTLSYDEKDNKCKRICKDNSDCQNGGSCEANGSLMTCSCPEGTDGPFCENVPSCKDLACGDDANCVYNSESKVGECRCKDENLSYDAKDNKCKSPAQLLCVDFPCYNGGTCSGESGTAKCSCAPGYSGVNCQIFSESECEKRNETCSKTNGKCISIDEQNVKCQCPKDTRFVPSEGCKDVCEIFVCYNDGKCQKENGTAKCTCEEGFSGKHCEIFSEEKCKEKMEMCVETEGVCTSVPEDDVKCICKKDFVFVEDEGCKSIEVINCKEVCGDNSDITCSGDKKNKEKINCICKNKNEEFDKEDKECKINYCKEKCGNVQCLGNKFEDNVKCNCSKPYEDFDEDAKKCKTNFCKKVCGLDEETIKCEAPNRYKNVNISCSCIEDGYTLKNQKCIRTCTDHSDCHNDKKCVGKEGSKTCDCKGDTFGDFCEKIVACEKGGKYEKCKDDKGDCKYLNGKAVCECSEENEAIYEKEGYCHVRCKTNANCTDNRVCNKDKFCVCKKGLEGDDCKEITGCKELEDKCTAIGQSCVYDESAELLATCTCDEGLKYYSAKNDCFPQCGKTKECGNNSECNKDNFCLCKDGYEGKTCSVVTGCKGDLGDKCKELGVDCIFDENSQVNATCNCRKGFKYDPNENKCKHELCYPVNKCKPANCSSDESTGIGYCKCPENQFYSYGEGKCKGFDDKCLLRKKPCDENHVCDRNTGECKCKYNQKKGEECKRKYCDPNPCFKGANCSESDGKCFCESRKYYKNKECIDPKCNIKEYKTSCKCPVDTKRNKDGEECGVKEEEKCGKDCGYGICKKEKNKENCKCFFFANNNNARNGTCTIKKDYCASGEVQESNPMKCKCEGKLKQADDGITCTLKTCDDDDVKKECESLGGKCVMKWKGYYVGYDCECPEGYDKDEDNNRKCSDPCSIQKIIKMCTDNGQVCYNSFSTANKITTNCNCPPTVKLVGGKCEEKAEFSYLFKNIPVKKEKYELKSGINKVLLNKHLVQSLQETFSKDLYEFGYLFDYNVQGDIVNCSAWVNFREAPTDEDLNKIKAASQMFSNVCEDCDDSVMIWPPNVFLSSTGLKEVEPDKQDFCKVKDRLCGKGAKCDEKNGKCTCAEGFQVVQYGILKIGPYEVQVCEDINECALGTHKCPKNTECVNTIGDYSCVCKEGFKKEKQPADPETDKSDCVDLCTPSPCKKGKCVVKEKEKSFDCECEPGVAGSYCQRVDEHYKSAKKSTVVVGAVLGTILIVGAIAVIYFIIKKKKRFGSEDFMPAPRMDHAEMTERRNIRGVTNRGYE